MMLNETEKTILSHVNPKFRFIAMDSDGDVYVFSNIPEVDECGNWFDCGNEYALLLKDGEYNIFLDEFKLECLKGREKPTLIKDMVERKEGE